MARKEGNRKFPVDEEIPSGGGWQIVFSGFVLILLCFFIMLSSFANMEKAKVLQFVESFSSSLSIMPGGSKLVKGERILPDSRDLVDARSELADIHEQLRAWVEDEGLAEGMGLVMTPAGLMIRFPDSLAFAVGSADLTGEAMRILGEIGSKIRGSGFPVRIEGHTDDVPIRTLRYPSNWELSTARAISVLRFFSERQGVAAERMTAMGFGAFRPLAPNESPEQRALNRRVDILLVQTAAQAANGPEDRESRHVDP